MTSPRFGQTWLRDTAALLQQALTACNPEKMEIVAITGSAGLGKTTLARGVAAHQSERRSFIVFDADHLRHEHAHTTVDWNQFAPRDLLGLLARMLGQVTLEPTRTVVVVLESEHEVLQLLNGFAAVPLPGQESRAFQQSERMSCLCFTAAHVVDLESLSFRTVPSHFGAVPGAFHWHTAPHK